jgi:hypothetical protein
MITNDVKLAYDAIVAKRVPHTESFAYYDGDQPLIYANNRLREIYSGVQVKFIENWCSVVIDACKERIQLDGMTVPANADAMAKQIWDDNIMALETDDLHEALLVTGESYLIVSLEEGEAIPSLYYNDPRLCHAFYRSDKPREMRMAAKMWVNDFGTYSLTLYYPDRLEYYITSQKAENVGVASAFVADTSVYPEGVAPNPHGQIPVFHFAINKRKIIGDLYNIVPVQNGINKLLTDMMVAAEYGAFKQRWVISNADPGVLKNSPNEIWSLAAGDGAGQATSVGEFSATDLKNYLDAINQLAGDIARMSRTPKHYFFSQGGDPSGEALIAMEAPLNRKVQDRIERVEPVWKSAFQFALELAGIKVPLNEIIPEWSVVETVQPKTNAEIRVLEVNAGIPLVTVLRREGWTDEQLDEMANDKEAEGADLGDAVLGAFEKGHLPGGQPFGAQPTKGKPVQSVDQDQIPVNEQPATN